MKVIDRIQLGPGFVRAAMSPETYDEEARTVEVTWSTGAEVLRYDWDVGKYIEALSMDPKHIRLDRLNAGASVLDNHSSYGGVRSILGVVERAWLEKGEGRAKLRFSNRDDVQDIVNDVRAGIIRHVSMGYRVHKFRDDTERDASVRRRTAIDWEPFEISLVTIPADAKAGVRSEPTSTNLCEIVRGHETIMEPDVVVEQTRTNPTPAAPAVDLAAVRAEAMKAERERAAEIREHCRAFQLAESEIEKLVDTGRSLGELTKEVREAYVRTHNERTNGDVEINTRYQVSEAPLQAQRAAISEVLAARILPTRSKPANADNSQREFRDRSLVDLMRMCLAPKIGESAAFRMSREEVMKRSMHHTSDFANLLTDTGRRTLLERYAATETTYQRWTRMGTLRDYNVHKRIQLGDAPKLVRRYEGGEIQRGTMGENMEPISLANYARAIELTREAVINDDLNAFADLQAAMAMQVAELVEDLAYTELISGTYGGSSLYSTSNPNRANYIEGAATALAATSAGIDALDSLAVKMQMQTSNEGRKLAIRPRFLIVPVGKERTAMKLMADTTPTKAEDVNPWRGRLEVVASPRLDDNSATAWYLVADPSRIPTIEIAWLDGLEGPQFDAEMNFNTKGLAWSVMADVAAKALDFRGFAKSKGSA